MKLGLKAIKANKALIRASIPVLLSTIIFVPLGTLLPLMVKLYFNGTAWHNGIVQVLSSGGMLIAALVIGITGGLKKQFFMISLGIFLMGICSLIGGMLPASGFWIFCIIVFIMGTTGMLSNIPFTAHMQKTIPAENLGKVISLITSIMSFAAPIGMFIAGPVSELIGVMYVIFQLINGLALTASIISFKSILVSLVPYFPYLTTVPVILFLLVFIIKKAKRISLKN